LGTVVVGEEDPPFLGAVVVVGEPVFGGRVAGGVVVVVAGVVVDVVGVPLGAAGVLVGGLYV
jgi:hypothetical protein